MSPACSVAAVAAVAAAVLLLVGWLVWVGLGWFGLVWFGWLVGWYKQRLRPSKQATRAYFGICLVFLKGVYGVFHRFEKELWCRLFPPLLFLVKASWAPF